LAKACKHRLGSGAFRESCVERRRKRVLAVDATFV
jgi:hypothetical protein